MDSEVDSLFRSAIDAYLEELGKTLEPAISYLPYDFDFIHNHKWHILGEQMVEDELRELTNIMNRWCGDLHRWHAWNNVIRICEEKEAWEVRREFVEALVHHCLLEPSAMRDRITFVATNAFHQVRLSSEDGYKDRLEGDPKQPNEKPVFLGRRKKEKRLKKVVSDWDESRAFIESLEAINDSLYQQATYDYRNRVNHAIGPRLGLGITQAVTRNVVQATQMERQPDGTCRAEPIPGKLSVSYGFGGTQSINLEEARTLNLQQYRLARTGYNQYYELLKSKVIGIKSKTENGQLWTSIK